MIMMHNIDIIKEIFNNLNLKYQIYITQCNKYFNNNLHIIDLYNIDKKYIDKLNDDILQNYKNFTKLNIKNNAKVKYISHLSNLKILKCSGYFSKISDEDILNLNLFNLNYNKNRNINKFNHMKNLVHLSCRYNNISDDHLIGLNLKSLDMFGSNVLINLNQFTNLKKLNCGRNPYDYDLKSLNLKMLAAYNANIKNISHMTNLKILNCGGYISKINDHDISKLNLIELYTDGNKYIKNISHLTNLKVLACQDQVSKIDQNSIMNLNLENIFCVSNKKIKNVSHMTNLKILNKIVIK